MEESNNVFLFQLLRDTFEIDGNAQITLNTMDKKSPIEIQGIINYHHPLSGYLSGLYNM